MADEAVVVMIRRRGEQHRCLPYPGSCLEGPQIDAALFELNQGFRRMQGWAGGFALRTHAGAAALTPR
jgi:hypothetical protein